MTELAASPPPATPTGLEDAVAAACGDPGQFVKRSRTKGDFAYYSESVPRWQARAVMAVVTPALAEAESKAWDEGYDAGMRTVLNNPGRCR